MNPFILNTYNSPEYFCNREDETSALLNAIENNRNITLFSLRKLGKTGLIDHVFYKLRNRKGIETFYIDLMPTNNLNEFIEYFGNAIIGKLHSKSEKLLSAVSSIFKSLRPKLSFDPITGSPEISLEMQTEKERADCLSEIFSFLKNQSKDRKIVVAFDEFQQIREYPEDNVEAHLRSIIQKLTNIVFIFSGSRKHLLTDIFANIRMPFYNSTQLLELQSIDSLVYHDFIFYHFTNNGIKIEKEAVDIIIRWCRNHTYYVQYLSNRLYSKDLQTILPADVDLCLLEVLDENNTYFETFERFLTSHQRKLIKAIACENGAEAILGKNFIKKYDLSVPTVQKNIAALLNKEMIFIEDGKYYVYDVFFSRWLERK